MEAGRRGKIRSRLFLLLILLAGLGAPLSPARVASAHPLGNFTINRYARIELYRDVVRIAYVLDFAEIPSFQEIGEIDANNNGASQDELDAWAGRTAGRVAEGLRLSVAAKPLPLALVAATASTAAGQSNLPIVRLEAVFQAPIDGQDAAQALASVVFSDSNYGDRLGWRELTISPSRGATVKLPGGYSERSAELRAYPASSLAGAPDEREVSFQWVVGTGEPAPAAIAIQTAPAAGQPTGFGRLIGRETSTRVVVLSVLAAMLFGMLHALGPGHGKTVVAAYLVGGNGTVRQAVTLGLTVTATHTSTVYVLGLSALWASSVVTPDRLYSGLSISSGLMVAVFGAALLLQRLVRRSGSGGHRHGIWSRPHSHETGFPTETVATETQDAGGSERLGWRGLVTLGVLGGLLPCPSAIVVMLAAISLGKVFLGMLLILAFSVGLAAVLSAIGVALTFGQRYASRSSRANSLLVAHGDRLQRAFLVLGPLVITVVGLVLMAQALRDSPWLAS